MKYTIELYVDCTNKKRGILSASTGDMHIPTRVIEDEFPDQMTVDECAYSLFERYFNRKPTE